jgi:hypothetical protein
MLSYFCYKQPDTSSWQGEQRAGGGYRVTKCCCKILDIDLLYPI